MEYPICVKCGSDSEWRQVDTKMVDKNVIDSYLCGGKDRVKMMCGNPMSWSYLDPKEKLK